MNVHDRLNKALEIVKQPWSVVKDRPGPFKITRVVSGSEGTLLKVTDVFSDSIQEMEYCLEKFKSFPIKFPVSRINTFNKINWAVYGLDVQTVYQIGERSWHAEVRIIDETQPLPIHLNTCLKCSQEKGDEESRTENACQSAKRKITEVIVDNLPTLAEDDNDVLVLPFIMVLNPDGTCKSLREVSDLGTLAQRVELPQLKEVQCIKWNQH